MSKKIAKSLSALLLVLAVAVTQIPVSDVEAQTAASDFQIDGNKLLKYTGTADVVSIPDHVKEIGEEAFAGNDDLVKVTIEGKVEKIGYRAFAECDSLRTVRVGDSVKEIETAAFSNDKVLANVTLGAGVKKLGSGVFAGSSELKELTVTDENTFLYYSDGVLYDDERTVIHALMPGFEKGAFTIPETVKEIKGYAFWGNPYLERVTLGSGLNEVPAYAFSNCMNLKEVEIPLPVRSIEAKAFEDCVNLKSVTIPETVTRIHDTAFDGCSSLEIHAKPGTYGAEFAASLKAAEVETVEYEDVQDSEVVTPDEVIQGQAEQETPSPKAQQDAAAADAGEQASPGSESPSPSAAPEPEGMVEETTQIQNNSRLLGESKIVSSHAFIFIDNGQPNVISGSIGNDKIDLGQSVDENTTDLNLHLNENAEKGKDFPKYTIVDDRLIASQAYYQDESLTEYEIGEGITEIGDFAFARTGLTSIAIPEGVEKIGYGAFYHCDKLENVVIPDSVTEIEANAFGKTPWLQNTKTATYPYLIAGDGILIFYDGTDSVVNIPGGVKQIGAEAFKDHMGITAVNIPDSVEIIGEAAFSGCKNLKTVNGGNQLKRVGDRAFMDCPLSQVTIPAAMEEIGLGAYSFTGGTDTVTFLGDQLPVLTMGDGAKRLSNEENRTYAFGTIKTAIIKDAAMERAGTVLEKGTYGLKGQIVDEQGTFVDDLSGGVQSKAEEGQGVTLQINSSVIAAEKEGSIATLPGNDGSYLLKISDSEESAEKIAKAYSEIYGGREPLNLHGLDISLMESAGIVPITKLGKQYITVQFPKPAQSSTEGLHVVTLDADGQLEAVDFKIVQLEDGDYIQFNASHFSPFGIYNYESLSGQATVSNGQAVFGSLTGNKDDTPDTGDFLHPKWILAIGLLAAAVALFFYKGNKKNSF